MNIEFLNENEDENGNPEYDYQSKNLESYSPESPMAAADKRNMLQC